VSVKFEQFGRIGVLTFTGDLNGHYLDDLRAFLMSAVENMDRVVLNFSKEIKIDGDCLELFSMAYEISKRLNRPLIFNGYRMKEPG